MHDYFGENNILGSEIYREWYESSEDTVTAWPTTSEKDRDF